MSDGCVYFDRTITHAWRQPVSAPVALTSAMICARSGLASLHAGSTAPSPSVTRAWCAERGYRHLVPVCLHPMWLPRRVTDDVGDAQTQQKAEPRRPGITAGAVCQTLYIWRSVLYYDHECFFMQVVENRSAGVLPCKYYALTCALAVLQDA